MSRNAPSQRSSRRNIARKSRSMGMQLQGNSRFRPLRHELLEDRRLLAVGAGWLASMDGPGSDTASDIAQDNGNAYVAGRFVSGTNFGSFGTPVSLQAPNSLVAPTVAVSSLAGMEGGNGGWSVLYGGDPIAADHLVLAVDEDQLLDTERSHIDEQAAYVVFEESGVITNFLETGVAANITDQWVTVPLSGSYSSAVVVATANYDRTHEPVVTRIRNVTTDSFDLRVQRADGLNDPISPVTVQFLVVEEGVYSEAIDGVQMEAVKFDSTVTDNALSWLGESRTYQNPAGYDRPVVLGQVMSANDTGFSAFWARGSDQAQPPSSTELYVGKHVGEDSNTTRADETIGYIVFEQTEGQLANSPFVAGLSPDMVTGVDDDSATEIVAKYDSAGELLWTVAVEGTTVEGLGVVVDEADNHLIVGGWLEGTIDFDPTATHPNDVDVLTSQGDRDLFILSLSVTGEFQWVSQVSGPGTEFFEGLDLGPSGDVYLTGYFWSESVSFGPSVVLDNPFNMTGFVAKLDNATGEFVWANGIGDIPPSGNALTDGWAVAYGVAVDPTDESVYVGGMFQDNTEFESTDGVNLTRTSVGNRDGYIAKYDSSGVLLRVDQFGAVANSTYDHLMRVYVRALAVDTVGNVFAVGDFGATSTGSSYPIPGRVDFDPGPGAAERTCVGNEDGFALKLDANGQFVNVQSFGGLSRDQGSAISVDANGQSYIVGQFGGTASFGSQTLTSEGVEDSFVSTLDTDFNYVRTHRLGGEGFDHARGVDVAEPGMILVTGDFQDTASLPTGELLSATGYADLFVAKINAAAPALNIETPTRGSASSFIAESSSFVLQATVWDNDLGANDVQWSLMPDDVPLGSGLSITVPSGTLPIGDHLIKASITDADGLKTVGSTTVTVASDVYPSSNAVNIPKSKGNKVGKASSTISVADSWTVFDVNVAVSIDWGTLNNSSTHLDLFLNSPTGTRVELLSAGQANLLGPAFDDEAAISVAATDPPYTGRFRPATPLSAFDGEAAQGAWTLEIENHSRNAATLQAWSLAITDSPPNEPPAAAVGGPYAGTEDIAVNFDASGSYDADGSVVYYTWDFGDGSAPVTTNQSTITYTYKWGDVFDVRLTVEDDLGATSDDFTTATITEVNDKPVAVDDSFSTSQDTILNMVAPGVLDNDTDADVADTLTAVFGTTLPAFGEVVLNSDGSFTYTPNVGFTGTDTFTYVANDGTDDSNEATVTIEVQSTPASELSINNVSKLEGKNRTTNFNFTITRSGDTSGTVTVDFATLNGTALVDSDYIGTSGTVTFDPGDTEQTVTVRVKGDRTAEPDETFYVNLNNATGGATISDNVGVGTIENDDGALLLASVEQHASALALSLPEAQHFTTLALALWSAQSQVDLPTVNVAVTDLPVGQLGVALGNTITLDINANGAGWYTDLNAPAAGQFDLLTVVTHEIGHLLGYEHNSDSHDVMAATLPIGTRRLPVDMSVVRDTLSGFAVESSLLIPRLRLDVTQQDPLDDRILSSDVAGDNDSVNDMWLLPLSPADYVDLPRTSPEAVDVRVLDDSADEETDLLDDDLLALLAYGRLFDSAKIV